MNVVASMGGIAGTQTLTLGSRGNALGQVSRSNHFWLMFKEIIGGLLNGQVWAVVIAVIAIFWFGNVKIGFVIAAATVINLIAVATAGVLLPLVMSKMNIDHALAGSVVLTAVTTSLACSHFSVWPPCF